MVGIGNNCDTRQKIYSVTTASSDPGPVNSAAAAAVCMRSRNGHGTGVEHRVGANIHLSVMAHENGSSVLPPQGFARFCRSHEQMQCEGACSVLPVAFRRSSHGTAGDTSAFSSIRRRIRCSFLGLTCLSLRYRCSAALSPQCAKAVRRSSPDAFGSPRFTS